MKMALYVAIGLSQIGLDIPGSLTYSFRGQLNFLVAANDFLMAVCDSIRCYCFLFTTIMFLK